MSLSLRFSFHCQFRFVVSKWWITHHQIDPHLLSVTQMLYDGSMRGLVWFKKSGQSQTYIVCDIYLVVYKRKEHISHQKGNVSTCHVSSKNNNNCVTRWFLKLNEDQREKIYICYIRWWQLMKIQSKIGVWSLWKDKIVMLIFCLRSKFQR